MSNEFDEAPVITGFEPAEAPGVDHLARQPRIIGVTHVPKSIGNFIADLMYRSSNPALAQTFVLAALENYSGAAKELDVVAFSQEAMGTVVDAVAWKEMAKELYDHIQGYSKFVNDGGLPSITRHALEREVSTMEQGKQQAIDGFIARVQAWDWTQPLDEEMTKLTAEIDPTGEITARFKPGQPH